MVATLRFVLLAFVATVILPGVASAAITVTASPTSVSGLGTDSTVVTAGAPVINAGIVQQEIIQQVDPSQIRVTGLAGITYPFGWTASYSMDGVTFGAAPVTQSGWNSIRAVKAAGPIESQGAFNGRQIATGTGTEVSPTSGSFVSTGGASGDGYDVFFDDQNHVFNVFHHDRWPNGRIDCHLRTGATCGPGWPFTIKGTTSTKSMAAVDTVYDHIWVPTGTPDTAVSGAEAPSPANKAGFVCLDIADLATGPRFCSGTFAASFIAMTPSYMTSTQFYGVFGLAVVGSRMFAWVQGEGTQANPSKLMCLDMHANGGLGAACPGSPLAVPGIDYADIFYGSVKASQGRLYALGYSWSAGKNAGSCIVPATLAPCTGWATAKTFSIGTNAAMIYEQPSATGVIEGVCFHNAATGQGSCFKEDGTPLIAHAGLKGYIGGSWAVRDPDTAGTRLYYSDYVSTLYCYDVALNNGAGGVCPGWPLTSLHSYTLVVDPYNANCVWRNGDDGVIKAYNSGGTVGCNSPPPWADLEANAVVPRMACDDAGAVREWRSFALTAPAANTFTTAKLTVYTAGGRVVVSGGTTWKDVTIPSGGSVDLSALSVSDSGVDPTFRVTFTGRSTWDNVTAKVTAVGDAPQLCVTYAAKSVCPAAAAQMPAGPFSSAFASTVSASGSATLADNSQQSFGTGSTGVTVGAAADSDCLGTISGTTTLSPSGAVAGVPVTLKDAAGNTIATTTTDASGNYSFTRLAAGSGYRVAFGSAGGFSPTAPTTSSASTDRSVAVASATTVNGVYTTVINAPNRSVSLPASTAGTFDPFALSGSSPPASPSSGQSFGSTQKALTRLCDPTTTPPQNGTSVPCTLTTRTTSQGTWTVNTTAASADVGKITFTPAAGFSGAATPMTYQVTDSGSSKAAGTLSPSVVGLPTATADPSSGPYNTPQAIDVLANDAAASGATLVASSVKLCDPAASPPENGSSVPCTKTSLTTAQGSYAVNATTGVVTFTPVATFTGTAPSVRYQVTDSANQTATALITPTVAAPAAPAATPETKVVARGASVAFTTLTAASGLATSGAAFTTSATCLLTPGTNTCDADGIVVVPGEGTWTLVQGTGIVTFVADANATPGSLTPIGYSVTDALSRTVTSMLTPVVPAPPVASDNAVSAVWNTPITIDPLANDQVDAVTSLQAATVRLCRISPAQTPPNCTLTTLAVPGEGTYVVDPATGRITFTPDPAFTGTATPIGYQVADGANQVTSANVAVTVAPVAPVAAGASAVVAYGGSTTLTPTVTQGTWPIDTTRTCLSSGATCSTTLTLPEGTYVLDPTTGVVAFTAAPGFSGAAPNPPQIVFTDTGGQTVSATLTVTVQPDPTPPATPQADPVALPDVESTGPGQPVTVPVLGNDAAAGVGSFDASSLLLRDPATGRYAKQVTIPKQGTFTVNADGTVTFTPVPGFTGTTTAVAYKVTDATGRTTNSTVQVIVHSGPPPWADPDYAQGPAGARLVLDPLANDNAGSSPFDPSTLRLVDPKTGKPTTRVVVPGEGTYVVDATTGRVTFTPKAGFAGTATPVVYTVRTRDGTAVESTLNPTIVASGPTLRIRTTASRAVLSVGQRTTITLRIANAGSATATGTVTRAMIPHGFSVVDRNGGTVHSSSIAFRTGSLKAGGVTMRTFVLIAGPSAIGEPRSVDGRSHGANVSPVADPVALRVVGGPSSMLPVTG